MGQMSLGTFWTGPNIYTLWYRAAIFVDISQDQMSTNWAWSRMSASTPSQEQSRFKGRALDPDSPLKPSALSGISIPLVLCFLP